MPDTPRVFVSYRWGEDEEWVERLVADLSQARMQVIIDRKLRKKIGPSVTTSEFLGFLVAVMQACHIFLPVFTPRYLDGIGYGRGFSGEERSATLPDAGFVFDEFQQSLLLGSTRAIETLPILRSGQFEMLPPGFSAQNTLDMRGDASYRVGLGRLRDYILNHRLIASKPIDSDDVESWCFSN